MIIITIMQPTIIRRTTIAGTITTMITAVMATITATTMLMTINRLPRRPRRRTKQAGASDESAACLTSRQNETGNGETAALYRLMTWLSPSFPVGAFSYSSGLEWAVEVGDITDAASLRDWLAAMLADGSGFCDAIFLAQAHRAALAGDDANLREVSELAAAFVPSRERHLETLAQGRAFIDIARAAWNCDALGRSLACCGCAIAYPIAVGLVSAGHAIPLPLTLHAFLHALTSNWISAGARLVPLGQTDSQRVLAALEPVVEATATRALAASLADLGSATFRADLASLRHEAQYTRLFRS
jgi:urease accessory protein